MTNWSIRSFYQRNKYIYGRTTVNEYSTAALRRTSMTTRHELVFLLDVDNTLLDNDRAQSDLKRYLDREVGPESCIRYWQIFEELRAELGYADYLGALQRYRLEHKDYPRLLRASSFLID